ncbi:MAG: hypothetical protein AMXMBFR7_26490 [Planctomycetota bacterium]
MELSPKPRPAIPAYRWKWTEVDAVMSRHFKQWAYELSLDGQYLTMHSPVNVSYARRLLKEAGVEDVCVEHRRLF